MKALALALFALASTLGVPTAQAQRYEAHDIGVLSPLGRSFGFGLNNQGQVAGISLTANGWRAFLTGPDGRGMVDLGTLGGSQSFATAVNDSGQVAGYAYTADFRTRAFITGPQGQGMTDLGTLDGAESFARGINASGQVVGYAGVRAFITGANGSDMRALGSGTSTVGRALDINDQGEAVGVLVFAPGQPDHAFVTGPGGAGLRDLGLIVGGPSDALAINGSGQVVVNGYRAGGGVQAFLIPAGGSSPIALNGFGGTITAGLDISSQGQVVGYAVLPGDTLGRAFVTGPGGVGAQDLNSLVNLSQVMLSEARAINDLGQILANGNDGRAYLLTPVPEPTRLVCTVLGLVMLLHAVRRSRSGHRR